VRPNVCVSCSSALPQTAGSPSVFASQFERPSRGLEARNETRTRDPLRTMEVLDQQEASNSFIRVATMSRSEMPGLHSGV
jgi:hypothetical protein